MEGSITFHHLLLPPAVLEDSNSDSAIHNSNPAHMGCPPCRHATIPCRQAAIHCRQAVFEHSHSHACKFDLEGLLIMLIHEFGIERLLMIIKRGAIGGTEQRRGTRSRRRGTRGGEEARNRGRTRGRRRLRRGTEEGGDSGEEPEEARRRGTEESQGKDQAQQVHSDKNPNDSTTAQKFQINKGSHCWEKYWKKKIYLEQVNEAVVTGWLFFRYLVIGASGLSKSKEIAQEQVFSGVGLLSGSTIFLLTIVWGTCVIVGQREFTETSKNKDIESSSSNDSRQQIRHSSFLTGHGIITDLETSHTAMIMVLSVVPFIIVQLPQLVNQPSWASIVILTSLIVSVLFLFGFFLYQVFEPWIPKRRLEYAKNDHLMVDFLKHVQKQATGRLLTKQGAPNLWAIRRLFASIDLDANNCLTANELQEKILDLMSDKIHPNDKDAVEDLMKEFDLNQDRKVSFDEFQHMFGKWLLKVKHEVNNHGSVVQSSIVNLYKERMIEHKNSRDLMEIMNHLPTDALGIFYNDDGEPNFNNLKGVFEKFDHDKDNFITSSESRELIHSMGKKGSKTDEVVEKFMKVLDKDGDGKIDEQEFVEGLSALFGSVKTLDDIYQAIDRLPLVPGVLELVGIGYSGWFAYI